MIVGALEFSVFPAGRENSHPTAENHLSIAQ
jgi:hypothetical protein